MRSRVRPLFAAAFAAVALAVCAASASAQATYQITQSLGAGVTPGQTLVAGTDNCDDCVGTVALPFAYTFYGQTFTAANVSSNGVLQFSSGSNDYGQFQICLPLSQFNNAILAHWTDLETHGGGEGIFTSTTGEPGSRVFNIEWRASYGFEPPGSLNFEIRLYEGQQRFDIVYGNVGGNGTSAPGGGIHRPNVGAQKGTGADYVAFSSECGVAAGGLRNGLQLAFTGTDTVGRYLAGSVTDTDGNPLSGVTVSLSGTSSAQTTTDSTGRYSFVNLTTGGSYTVTASQLGSNFYPGARVFGSGSFVPFTGSQLVNFVRTPAPQAGDLLISEVRFRGPQYLTDEYVELYNNTNSAIVVNTTDGTSGWLLQAADASTVTQGLASYILPRGTVIPARAHLLLAGTGYTSMFLYAPGDDFLSDDVPDDDGVAIFSTANAANLNTSTRLDAVGFNNPTTPVGALYREGAGLAPVGAYSADHAFVRKLNSGVPQDTGDNASDFVLVSTSNLAAPTGALPVSGAPAPENLYSPVTRNSQIKGTYIDPGCVGTGTDPASACARVRVTTPVAGGAAGTLSIRRRWTNRTSTPVTALRFRVVDLTTLGSRQPGEADLRALSSSNVSVTTTTGTSVPLKALVLEQTPPSQPNGGGVNSSLRVGSITLGTPLAPGASVDVEFRLGVQTDGTYRIFINVEAATATPPPPPATGSPSAPKTGGGFLQEYPKTLPSSVKQ
ncbi:MAG: carboxypeptidase regulatory-like domain-containing protein [Pyrinomonadaceae bacterium]